MGRKVYLEGRLERRIQVDYYIDRGPGLALEVVARRRHLLAYMEQWGWRWTDLHAKHPKLLRAMVCDPDRQSWDQTELDIGRSVCDVFYPYFETGTIDAAVRQVSEA